MGKIRKMGEVVRDLVDDTEFGTPRLSQGRPPIPTDSLTIEQLTALFFHAARKVCPGFRLTEEISASVGLLFDWALRVRAAGAIDPDKGLLLYGSVGAGKTTMIHIIREFASYVRPVTLGRYRGDTFGEPYSFAVVSCRNACDRFTDSYYRGIRDYCRAPAICFDELGAESIPTLHYGTAENVMAYIIGARYDRLRDLRATHFTTNMAPRDIRAAYGDRIYDRLREMVNFVEFTGKSFRKG